MPECATPRHACHSNHSHFNYSRYWHEHARKADSTRPPRVYVYRLPPPYGDLDVARSSREDIFGSGKERVGNGWISDGAASASYYRISTGYAFAAMVQYRLHHSKVYRTFNPEEADLFLVPILTKPKTSSQLIKACAKLAAFGLDKLVKKLPYLTEATASRHVLLGSKEHTSFAWYNCTWFFNPSGLLARMIRIAYSSVQPAEFKVSDYATEMRMFYDDSGLRFPNLRSVPFPSSVHMDGASDASSDANTTAEQADAIANSLPWATHTRRKYRMLFIGGADHGDVDVRKKLLHDCQALREPRCKSLQWSRATGYSLLLAKREADFCLEPAGDSPFRKSLADSISLGCIPVLFHPMTDHANEWLWDDWKEAGRILVPRERYLRGEVDLHRLLISSMPPPALAHMKHVLSSNARKFTISFHDDPEDELHAILVGARRLAESLERIHQPEREQRWRPYRTNAPHFPLPKMPS